MGLLKVKGRNMHIHSLPLAPPQLILTEGGEGGSFISISLSCHQTLQVSLWAGLVPKGRVTHYFQSHQRFQRRCKALGNEESSDEDCTAALMEKTSSNCRRR